MSDVQGMNCSRYEPFREVHQTLLLKYYMICRTLYDKTCSINAGIDVVYIHDKIKGLIRNPGAGTFYF